MDDQIKQWEVHTRCVLSATRSKSNAEALFVKADTDKRALLAERKKAASAVFALDALIDAHFKILASEDFDEGIKTLKLFLNSYNKITQI